MPRLFPVLGDREPLHVFPGIWAAADQGNQVIHLIARAGSAAMTGSGTRILSSECSDLRLAALDRLGDGGEGQRNKK
jgi:hypothetical protein